MNTGSKQKKLRGRPSSFNREALVETVMNLFWERGYGKLSFNEIAKDTGLTRASLYNSFETKEALFLEAMRHYFSQSPDAVLDSVQEGDPVAPAFYRLFAEACRARGEDPKRRGCLAVNCVTELIADNTELSDSLGKMYMGRRDVIERLLAQAVAQGELPAGTDPEIQANMMLSFMSGFSVFSKSDVATEKLCRMCRNFLQQFGFKEPG